MNALTAPAPPVPDSAPKLLDRVRAAIRVRHYSIWTEDSSVDWIKRSVDRLNAGTL